MTSRYILNKLMICLPLLALGLGSCNKKLGLSPTDTIDAGKAYRTIEDLNAGLTGAYASLTNNTIRNVSLTSDECMLPDDNSTGKYVASFRWQYDPSSTTITDAWRYLYVTIDRLNRVLAAADQITVPAGKEPLRKQYKGELLALRAYCHLELLRQFAEKYEAGAMGIPYMTASVLSYPERNDFGTVIRMIHADLEQAKTLLPASLQDRSKLTLPAVSAIQARTALYAKDWVQAATYAQAAIDQLPLASPADFKAMWARSQRRNDAEVFWRILAEPGDEQAQDGDGLAGSIYYDTRQILLYAPSFELIRTLDEANDVRFAAYIKRRDEGAPYKAPFIVSKYQGNMNVTPNLADMIPFRTGEMYLILAEALAEQGRTDAGATALNTLRAARITGYTNQTFSGKDALITAIYEERFKELAFEGHRFFDLRRRNLPITRDADDAANAIGAKLLNPTDAQYVYPIPDAEIRANKHMIQNPHY
ncbi:RagB/SusD family nutrient uptake outer membrane protein [Chitinophaga pendula]|uniref:RagB/SusD family nutrient uptake outer membrane protein n=1 Tax=Chitinophaga TaxID=79328 RepID=UPI0018DF82B7|nr:MULTISPECIES: RagB/SusD family nutrient uptake outer membrane protein [Chitinophaga]UCJ05777.1 RagB/SusD family nutrient uptake outer membrane protein [Chitinophaga pendula]